MNGPPVVLLETPIGATLPVMVPVVIVREDWMPLVTTSTALVVTFGLPWRRKGMMELIDVEMPLMARAFLQRQVQQMRH